MDGILVRQRALETADGTRENGESGCNRPGTIGSVVRVYPRPAISHLSIPPTRLTLLIVAMVLLGTEVPAAAVIPLAGQGAAETDTGEAPITLPRAAEITVGAGDAELEFEYDVRQGGLLLNRVSPRGGRRQGRGSGGR